MRLAGPDIVLFIVGLLLFSGAGYAIVTTDGLSGTGSALGVYNVGWTTAEAEIETSGVDSFRDASIPFTIETLNVSLVTFTIDCSDPAGPAGAAATFQLSITVTSPDGNTTEPQTAACAPGIVVDVAVAETPGPTVAQGGTEDAAAENLPLQEGSNAAVGAWTLTITGDRGSAPVLPVPVTEPTGTATLSVTTWEPTFTPGAR